MHLDFLDISIDMADIKYRFDGLHLSLRWISGSSEVKLSGVAQWRTDGTGLPSDTGGDAVIVERTVSLNTFRNLTGQQIENTFISDVTGSLAAIGTGGHNVTQG